MKWIQQLMPGRVIRRADLILLSIFISASLMAQQPREQETALTSLPQSPAAAIKFKSSLGLPFEDDFSQDGQRKPNPNLWEDQFVYINNQMAIEPITYGVASFDGLDEYGQAYRPGDLNTDTADMLTSLPIDLSNTTGTTILRFYFQAGGLAEAPSSSDSLALYFYSPAAQRWYSVWRSRGNSSARFRLVQEVIDSNIFLQDNFQFRFISYGSGAGAFDVWHLDKVELSDLANLQDTLFDNPSFVRDHPSLLQDYSAIPWFHYQDNLPAIINKDQLSLYYRRNREAVEYNLGLNIYRISYNGTVLSENLSGNDNIDDTHTTPNIVYNYIQPLNPFLLPAPPTGEFELEAFSTYDGINVNIRDTLFHTQVFKNYYAYDDGSAERAYRITDNQNGFIVNRYDLLTDQDSTELKGLYIYFSPGINDISDNSFRIVVYANENGIPGQLIYESDSIYTPNFSERNFYLPYALDTNLNGISLAGQVFIGIRQLAQQPLTLGFDKNTANPTATFYGRDNTFSQSFLQGTVMMRPFFEYVPDDLSREKELKNTSFNLYPNPASDILRLRISDTQREDPLQFTIYNSSGIVVEQGVWTGGEINCTGLSNGIYFFQLMDPRASTQFTPKKLIISR